MSITVLESNTATAEVPDPPDLTVIDFSDIAPAAYALPELPFRDAVEEYLLAQSPRRLRRPLEAVSAGRTSLVAGVDLHPFVHALHMAFSDHRPAVLSPDAIWLLIAQGFANHVNANAEQLRPRFVRHDGKLELQVRRDDFVKGSPRNPWREVFEGFSTGVRTYLDPVTNELLLPRFSTTTADDIAAAQIVLLDTLESYFDFELLTLCGIPQIVLEGTAEDWEEIAVRVRGLARFDLEWWTKYLVPIVDEFVLAKRGRLNETFWRSIYKTDPMHSGGPYVNGWINGFFPYVIDGTTGLPTTRHHFFAGNEVARRRRFLDPLRGFDGETGATTQSFSSGLSSAPFCWNYLGRIFEMEFVAGFVGVHQEPTTLRLRPQIGWAVRAAQTVS